MRQQKQNRRHLKMNDKIKNQTDPILAIRDILQQPTPEDLVQWKVQSCTDWGMCTMVCYTDARLPRKILDEAVGIDGWETRYERDSKGQLFCYITLHFPNGRSITKGDCGVPSQFESEKGEASDAFKRACFAWGICADLYDLGIYQVQAVEKGVDHNGKKKWDTWGLKGWKPSANDINTKEIEPKVGSKIDEDVSSFHNPPINKEPDPIDEDDQRSPDPFENEIPDFLDEQPDPVSQWETTGRKNSIGFGENASSRWEDIDVKFLWWILNKMNTTSDNGAPIKVNVERKVMASKEVIYRHKNDLMSDDLLRDLAKAVVKEHSNG